MHIPQGENEEANKLAQHVSSFKEVLPNIDISTLQFSKVAKFSQHLVDND